MPIEKAYTPPLRPHFGDQMGNWLAMLRENEYRVDPRYIPRALFFTFNIAWTYPFRLYDSVVSRSVVNNVTNVQAPVFIIGHWRSGTTHLHNIMSHDARFGYVTNLQTTAPQSFLSIEPILRPFLKLMTPKTRSFDNVRMGIDMPQEEEIALASTASCCSYLGLVWRRRMLDYFRAYALFENVSKDTRKMWKAAYRDVLRRATLHMKGKRLLLKNPPNTARIPLLLEMWPDAKFIHIVRNPYDVYPSTVNLHKSIMQSMRMQNIPDAQLDEDVLTIYRELMGKYLRDKGMLSPSNLCEIRFEDLESNPIETVRGIYDQLGLPSFDEAEPAISGYLNAQAGYEKNEFELDDRGAAKVSDNWGFICREYGYSA